MIKFLQRLSILISFFVLTSCAHKSGNQRSPLSAESHSKSATPNYSIVFSGNKVNRIDIEIDKIQWNNMLVDLKSNIGVSGRIPPGRPGSNPDLQKSTSRQGAPENTGQQGMHSGPPPRGFQMHAEMKSDSIHSRNREHRMGPPPGGMPGGAEYKPIWAYCNILFNNEKWEKVGIRFKGNSSLRSAFQAGIKKLPFKLDFDQFETEFPETKDQRFYGFKQLNLKNNYDDKSFVREKVAADLFADFGLVTPKTSFYQVFVDYGDGPVYFGLYTLVEEVDDTVIKTSYSDKNGNLYKPEGIAATFADGSFRSTDMNKKNNKRAKDYSDVQKLYTIINSPLRVENPERWKSQLSEVFDVPVFLKWLAANTVMQNWDTYGNSVHNYYLYNNPSGNKLAWIPWDNNEAFQHGKMKGALSLSLNEVGDNWPLIRYILDNEEWKSMYHNYLSDFAENVFEPKKMSKVYDNYKQLILSSVVGEKGEQKDYSFLTSDTDFFNATESLKNHVYKRYSAVHEYLQQQNF